MISSPATAMEKGNELDCVESARTCADIHGALPSTNFGYKFMFVLLDIYSKFVKIYPLKKLSSKVCLDRITKDFIPRYGQIESILTDNASIFTSKTWDSTLVNLGVRILHCSSYFPSGNAVERQMRTIGLYLRVFCHKNHKKWLAYCPIIEKILNRSPNPATRITPEFLFTGAAHPPLFTGIPAVGGPTDALSMADCERAYQRQVVRAERRRNRTKRSRNKWEPRVGDLVWAKAKNISKQLTGEYSKMKMLFRGPYVITAIDGTHTYTLKDPKNDKVFGKYHKQLLKKYVGPQRV